MKNLILILTQLLLLSSCVLVKKNQSEFIELYKQDGIGEILPEYLILRNRMNLFEMFYPGLNSSVLGKYSINNDTLYFNPKYEYLGSIKNINPTDTCFIFIPRKFLIKKDLLIDVTDYDNYPIINLFIDKEESIYKKI